jgi:anti-anti-sigma factor
MSTTAVFHPRVTSRRRDQFEPASSGILVGMVRAQGPLDAEHVESVEHELAHAIEAGATRLLVDLARVNEITTAGMNVLLAARQKMFEQGGRIAVVLTGRLQRRFEVLELDRRFALASSRLQAAQQLGIVVEGEPTPSAPGRPRRPHAFAA